MALGAEYQRHRSRFDPGALTMVKSDKISDTYLVGDNCACGRPAVAVGTWQVRHNLSAVEHKALCRECGQAAVQGQTPPRRIREHDRARIDREKAEAARRAAARAELRKAQESMSEEWGRR